MSQRSTWKGQLSFGLVVVPTKLYLATEEKRIRFNQLHRDCGERVRMPKVCEAGHTVNPADIVKGYEVSKGEFIVMDEADFDELPVASKHVIEVTSFVPVESIDPVTFHKGYYLQPDDAGVRGYSLLHRAMLDAGQVGIGKIAFREEREHLAVVRPVDDTLMLHTLYWPDEIRQPELAKLTDVASNELKMARTLIENLDEEFDPSAFTDDYRTVLMERIEAKVSGSLAAVKPITPPKSSAASDLMQALQASVKAAPKKAAPARKTTAKRKAPAKRKAS